MNDFLRTRVYEENLIHGQRRVPPNLNFHLDQPEEANCSERNFAEKLFLSNNLRIPAGATAPLRGMLPETLESLPARAVPRMLA